MKPRSLSEGFKVHSDRILQSNAGHKALTQHEAAEAAAAGAAYPARIEIYLDGGGTASWAWNGKAHVITMGTESTLQLRQDLRGDLPSIKELGHALLSHECCHGLYTSRNLGPVVSQLEAGKIPFRLFNLLEDARIEHKGRAAGISFGWDAIGCERQSAVVTPAGLFFAFVASEASAAADPIAHALRGVVWCGSRLLPDGRQVVPLVAEYYARACAAPSSEEAATLTAEWVSIFGMEYAEVPRTVGCKVGPVEDKADEWVIASKPNKRPGTVTHPGWSSWHSMVEKKSFVGSYVDRPQADRVKSSMRALLNAQDHTPDITGSEGTRLNLPGVIGGEPTEYWQVTRQRAEGRRRVLLVIDMSGSMQVFWSLGGGREFALAMVELAQAGEIELRVILSGHSSRAELPVQGLREVDIISLWPSAGDSMDDTLKTPVARDILQWATSVIVWTDGDLNSGDKVGHKLAQEGVRFLACSTCEDKLDAMRSHFPVVAVAANVATVASKVAEAILEGDADAAREGGA